MTWSKAQNQSEKGSQKALRILPNPSATKTVEDNELKQEKEHLELKEEKALTLLKRFRRKVTAIKDHDTEKRSKTPQKPQHPKKNQQHKACTTKATHPKNQQNNAAQNNKNKHERKFERKKSRSSKGNRSNNRYKDPDFEFDGIIESEGVLEMMPDGYGF